MRQRIAIKLAKVSVAIAFIVGFLLSSLQIYGDYQKEEASLNKAISEILRVAERSATASVHTLSEELATEVIVGLLEYDYIQDVTIVDDLSIVLAEQKKPRTTTSNTQWITKFLAEQYTEYEIKLYPESVSADTPGKLRVIVNVDTALAPFFSRSIVVFASGIVRNSILVLLLFLAFHYIITRPLISLSNELKSLNIKDLNSTLRPLPHHGNDEFNLLVDSANKLIKDNHQLIQDLTDKNITITKSESNLKTLVETIPDLVWLKNPDGVYLSCNHQFERFFGAREEEIVGRTDYDFLDKELADLFRSKDQAAIEAKETISNEEEVIFADDGYRAVLHTLQTPMFSTDGHLIGVLGIARDVTSIKQTERDLKIAEERFRALYNDNPLMLITVNKDYQIESINRFGYELLGYQAEELIGTLVTDLYTTEDQAQVKQNFAYCFQNPLKVHQWELRKHSKQDDIIYVHETVRVIYGSGEEPIALIVCEDISIQKETESQLTYNESHDMLTGLMNRREFEDRVKLLLAKQYGEKTQSALCYLDLDQFKVVNDTCGHAAGDELLNQLSTLLNHNIRRNDILARLGGDEFGVLMENCNIEDAQRLAETLLKVVKEFVFAWEDSIYHIGVSIGLVSISYNTQNLTELLKEADAACYMAKELGRNRIHIYEKDDVQIAERQGEMLWVNRIQGALETDRFCLFAQEILSLDNEQTSHYELLVRMIDEEGSLIPPGLFLPAAERFDIITNIDYWVVEAAFKTLQQSPSFLSSITFVSINLSGPSLAAKDFHIFVENKLAHYQIPPHKICFEITETAAITNLHNANQFIRQMKRLGCQFALDDFGSGLSSFGYLKQLPVEYLKIDGMFVKDIESDPIDLAMVESINQIGHVMGMKTIAEFVENEEIKTILTELGVDYAQGYGIGKPILFEHLIKK